MRVEWESFVALLVNVKKECIHHHHMNIDKAHTAGLQESVLPDVSERTVVSRSWLVRVEEPEALAEAWAQRLLELLGKLLHSLTLKTLAEDGTDRNGEDAHGDYRQIVATTFGL